MATVLPRPTPAPSPLRQWRTAAVLRARKLIRRASARSGLLRDPFLLYTASLTPIAFIMAVVDNRPGDLPTTAMLSGTFVGLQMLLGIIPTRSRPLTPLGWSFCRLAVSLLLVAGLAELVGGPVHPLAALYVAVVVGAAAVGTSQAIVIGAVAALIFLAPELAVPGSRADVALRGITLAGVSVLVAVGTRRLVSAVERTTAQLRSAMVSERRHSRQIAGMEAVSRLLVSGGPADEALDGALGVLVEDFHYQYVSIYLLDGDILRLGAQRGYETPRQTFEETEGVVGRVMRSHELAFIPDVTADPDYVAIFDEVVSEICAPLIDRGQFLGILNVESRHRLDRSDRDLVATLGGRIGMVVASGRDRRALAERASIFHALNEFTNEVSAELDLDRLSAAMVDAARKVIVADLVTLVVLERETGRYLLRAATDTDSSVFGREIKPGEGLAGRAIRDRTIVVDEHFSTDRFPAAYRDTEAMTFLGAGVPLLRDGVVVGAMSILRRDLAQPFRPIEHEAMELIAGHAGLAVSNAFLHAEVAQLATRDSLTALYNRRYFDEALVRVIAGWRRATGTERRPVAAIMFDLDHFGEFNRQHGHQIGDEVLRTFASLLRSRFRDVDLVARFGGEEFVAILEGATRDDAVRIAEEVRASLTDRPVLGDDGARLPVTVSAGCAELDQSEPTGEQLLRTADVALFMAKRAGRNRVVAA